MDLDTSVILFYYGLDQHCPIELLAMMAVSSDCTVQDNMVALAICGS